MTKATRTTKELKPGNILTAVDASGQRHAVTFGILNGNGVLLALNLTDAALPLVLAFGDNRCVPIDAPGPAWVFYSYARMQPALRGAPVHGHPGREAILLMRD
ncbi:hypothetical protein ACMT4L_03085 [Deinococcus sp. A31D244]|uniref:hypothetical protein n=1 Tax=Deinococcus sp. A31D244 TaxID=3397675 RepID=UPI0039E17FD6